jgi:hypothetical protein
MTRKIEQMQRMYRLVGADGSLVVSSEPGTLGGYRKDRRYGRLDCKVARRALEHGGHYARQRVFFKDESTAIAAGYHPCASCMPDEYAAWKANGRR